MQVFSSKIVDNVKHWGLSLFEIMHFSRLQNRAKTIPVTFSDTFVAVPLSFGVLFVISYHAIVEIVFKNDSELLFVWISTKREPYAFTILDWIEL